MLFRSIPVETPLAAFADLIGVSLSHLRKCLAGTRRILPARCVEIEVRTGGRVTRQMLRPDLWPPDHHTARRLESEAEVLV